MNADSTHTNVTWSEKGTERCLLFFGVWTKQPYQWHASVCASVPNNNAGHAIDCGCSADLFVQSKSGVTQPRVSYSYCSDYQLTSWCCCTRKHCTDFRAGNRSSCCPLPDRRICQCSQVCLFCLQSCLSLCAWNRIQLSCVCRSLKRPGTWGCLSTVSSRRWTL